VIFKASGDAVLALKIAQLEKASAQASSILQSLRHDAMLKKGGNSQVPVLQNLAAETLGDLCKEEKLNCLEVVTPRLNARTSQLKD